MAMCIHSKDVVCGNCSASGTYWPPPKAMPYEALPSDPALVKIVLLLTKILTCLEDLRNKDDCR